MSKYDALKKKHSNLLLSYDKLELDNKDNISQIKSLKERINHMTIENRSLKERHIPQVLIEKPPMISKAVFNYKRSLMQARSSVDKVICHVCNQVDHLKVNCLIRHKSLKCIWVPKRTMTNCIGPKQVWVPKISS